MRLYLVSPRYKVQGLGFSVQGFGLDGWGLGLPVDVEHEQRREGRAKLLGLRDQG